MKHGWSRITVVATDNLTGSSAAASTASWASQFAISERSRMDFPDAASRSELQARWTERRHG